MAYGVGDINQIRTMQCSSEYADDGSVDLDWTTCGTNGTTTGEKCDELKEGTLNARIDIGIDPAQITAFKIRFYISDEKTAGDFAVVPYIDSDSVSSTNASIVNHTGEDVWIEHTLSSAAIAELADLGSGTCAVRLAATANGKMKYGEVETDITYSSETTAYKDVPLKISLAAQTYKMEGVTKDKTGSTLANCHVFLCRDNQDNTASFVSHTTSDGSGNYSFTGLTNNSAVYFVLAWKDDSPHVFDVTDHVLQPVEE